MTATAPSPAAGPAGPRLPWFLTALRLMLYLFAAFEIYSLVLLSLYARATELTKLNAQLVIEREKAAVAVPRHQAEMQRVAAEAKIKLAEADQAVRQAQADAQKLTFEAITEAAKAEAAAATESAKADKLIAEAQIAYGKAQSAQAQAKADAELLEQQVAKLAPTIPYLEQSVQPKIAEANQRYAMHKGLIERHFIGRRMPDINALAIRGGQ